MPYSPVFDITRIVPGGIINSLPEVMSYREVIVQVLVDHTPPIVPQKTSSNEFVACASWIENSARTEIVNKERYTKLFNDSDIVINYLTIFRHRFQLIAPPLMIFNFELWENYLGYRTFQAQPTFGFVLLTLEKSMPNDFYP